MNKNIPQKVIHKYLRHHKKFPHVWCSGCGNGIILGDLLRAIYNLKLDNDDIAIVSGIGCSSRMPVYIDFNTLHTTHGRAISYATGIKFTKPNMKVIVITGDGDAAAIGGNHLIHAARRNIDLTILVLNNNIYGMTGGQCSPTTYRGDIATTSPYGSIEADFDLCELAYSAGAGFVARTTAYHTTEARKIIEKAIMKNCCSIVDIITQCPISYGRMNNMADPVEMLKWQRDNTIPIKAFSKLPKEKTEGKIPRGILYDLDKPTFIDEYEKLSKRLMQNSENSEEKK
ncbi:MAG: 2-oxoacid:ferredoxin oxidoreductase subunit beta [Candidatus Cloacimonetes bacterium]|nr:2-oxoacid:ferredoxin oxidoreductase subunit beta [Candidatus Cloacimonadota bacterium]MBL7108391.1 2-oxoacid:ferredoxin oxidoreductase subunit beta [Candidatus Cloacimonadota bacterium]